MPIDQHVHFSSYANTHSSAPLLLYDSCILHVKGRNINGLTYIRKKETHTFITHVLMPILKVYNKYVIF